MSGQQRPPAGNAAGAQSGTRAPNATGGAGRGRGGGMPANMAYPNPQGGQYGQRAPYVPQMYGGMMPGYPYTQQQQPYGVPQGMPYPGYQMPAGAGAGRPQPFMQQPTTATVYHRPNQQGAAQPTEAAAKPAVAKPAPKKKSKAIRIVNPDSNEEVKVDKQPPAAPKAGPAAAAVAASSTPTGTGSPAASSPAGTPGSIRKSKALKISRPDGSEVMPAPAPAAGTAEAPESKPDATATDVAEAGADGADGADDAAAAAVVEEKAAGPPPKAPAPAANQWTPSNTGGEKSYSKSFMSGFKGICTAPPPSFRDDIEAIMANSAARAGNGGKGDFKQGKDWMQQGITQGFRPPQRNGPGGANNRGGRPPRPQGGAPRAGQKVINLPGRNRETPKLNKSDNAFVISTKKKAAEKDTFKEVTVRLNKLTLEKFDILALQIKDLLVADLEKVDELVKTIFEKAIDEEFFSMIYAKLCKYLANAKEAPDDATEAIVGFRKTLLNCCQQEFEKATLADAAGSKEAASKKEAAAAAEKADADAGIAKAEPTKEEAAKLREEEREAGYARNKIKRHMLGNIRFIGELFKEDLVSSKIMLHCINYLMPDKNAEEENMENLCKLLDTAGGKWETQMLKAKKNKKATTENENTVKKTFETMKAITVRPGLASRIKFAVLDILDLRDRKWKPRMEAKGPKMISEVHAEANLEQIKIQQQSGGKGGGGGGGRGSSGGGRRDQRGSGGGRGSDGWTNVAPRRPEKVDAGRFGGSSSGGSGGNLRLGAPSLGGVRLGGGTSGSGSVQGGRYVKKTGASNPFAALAGDSSSRSAPPRGGSPLLQPKQSSLLKSAKMARNAEKATSPTPVTAAPKFSKDELDRKINGCLDEYLSIVDLNEVKESLKEWGHPDATQSFALSAIKKGAEASEKHRALFAKLFVDIVGKEGGVPAATFIEAVTSFLPSLPDLMYDAPRAHEYLGVFIASAATSAPEVIKVLLKIEDALKAADDDGGPELPLKLVLATFGAAKKDGGDEQMLEMYAALGVSVVSFLADDEERVADLCDRAGVNALLAAPAASNGSGGDAPTGSTVTLESLLDADVSNDQIFEWVDANVKVRDADFVARLTELIVLGTSKKTTCATAEDMQKPPSAEMEAAETEAVKNRSKALKVYTDGSDALQLHTLCAVQAAAHQLKNPPGLLGRWFNNLYDMDVVLEDVFKTWETDETISISGKYPGKVLARTGANDLMDRLKNGAVEEDPAAE